MESSQRLQRHLATLRRYRDVDTVCAFVWPEDVRTVHSVIDHHYGRTPEAIPEPFVEAYSRLGQHRQMVERLLEENPMPRPYNGITGTMDRTAFEAAYEPVPRHRHRQADVLMELLEGDPTQVQLYPANASVAVWPWRTFWRKKKEATP